MIYTFFESKDIEINQERYKNLSLEVEDYMKAVILGKDNNQATSVTWGTPEEVHYINQLLSPAQSYVNFPAVPLIPSPHAAKFTIPTLANLLATLTILHGVKQANAYDVNVKRLEQLGIMSLVQAGMPGPTLIYLDGLLKAKEYDKLSKIFLIDEVINSLENKRETFGFLGNIVLLTAIEAWRYLRESLTNLQKKALEDDHQRYKALFKVLSATKVPKPTPFLDRCIEIIWEKIGVDIYHTKHLGQATCSNSAMKNSPKALMEFTAPCTLSL